MTFQPTFKTDEIRVNTSIDNAQAFGAVTNLPDGGFVVTWSSLHDDGVAWNVYAQIFDSSGAPVGSEFRVNSTTADSQLDSTITALKDGGFVIAWDSNLQDGSGTGIFLQRYDASGTEVGQETQVNTFFAGEQARPHIASLEDGGYLVTWDSLGQDAINSYGVYAQRYDSNGDPVGGEFRAHASASGPQWFPQSVGHPDGGYTITWRQFDSNGSGIYAQRFDVDGAPQGAQYLVNSTQTSTQQSPSIISLSDGGYVIAWESFGNDGSDWGIFGQIFNVDGSTRGGEFQLNSTTADTQRQVSLSALEDGGFIAIWESANQDGSAAGVYAQRFDSEGGALGSEFLVNQTTDSNQLTTAEGRQNVATLEDGSVAMVWYGNGAGDSEGVFVRLLDVPLELTPAPTGSETLVNTTIANQQRNPSLTSLDDGGYVVTWESDAQGGSDPGIFAQIYDADGVPKRGQIPVFDIPNNDQNYPAIAKLEDGSFVIAWSSFGQDGSFRGIFYRRYDSDGTGQSGAIQANTTTQSNQDNPSISALSDGGFLITWESQIGDGSGFGVYGQRYDENGLAQGGEFRVNSTNANDQYYSDSVGLEGGGFVVTWQSFDSTTGTWEIYSKSYSAGGTPTGPEVLVNTTTVQLQQTPSIAETSGGGFVIVWQSLDQDGSNFGIFGQRFDPDGNKNGPEFQVNTFTASNQMFPAVISLDDGGFLVSWSSIGQDGDDWGVFGQRFDANGSPVGEEFIVNETTTGVQLQNFIPRTPVDQLADGSLVFAWQGNGPGDSYGIFTRSFSVAEDPSALPFGSEFVANTQAASNQTEPSIADLPGGGFVLVWTTFDSSQDGSNEAVKGQVFDAAGAAVGSEFLVNTLSAQGQVAPSVSALADGGFVVSWVTFDSAGGDASGNAIKAQVFDASGTKVGNEFLVNTETASSQNVPVVSGLPDGGFVASWVTNDATQDGSSSAIKAQLFDATGGKVGSEFLVNSAAANLQFEPTITDLADGGFVISWTTFDFAQDGNGRAIKAKVYDANGDVRAAEFLVNTISPGHQEFPSVAALSSGGFVITWRNEHPSDDGSGAAVKAQIYDASGNTVGGEFLANTETILNQGQPQVTPGPDGGFLIAWRTLDTTQDGDGFAIKGQLFDATGGKIGSEFLVNERVTGDQTDPVVTTLESGDFAFSWITTDTAQDGSGTAIMVRLLDNGVVNTAPEGSDNTITIDEDSSHTFAAADFGFTDADSDDSLQSVRIDTLSLDPDATLELNSVAVAEGDEIPVGDIGNLVFTPGADENGADYSSFTFSVSDGEDFDAAPNTITFDVTPVNDAPREVTTSSDVFTEIAFEVQVTDSVGYGTIAQNDILSGAYQIDPTSGEIVAIRVDHPTEGSIWSDDIVITVGDNVFGGTQDVIAIQGRNPEGELGGVVPGLASITIDLRGTTDILSSNELPDDLAVLNAFDQRTLQLPNSSNPDASTGVGLIGPFAEAPYTGPIAVTEDGPLIGIATSFIDPDLSDTHSFDVDVGSTTGAVTNNGDGTFDYSPIGRFEQLDDGDQVTDSFIYTLDDGQGGVASETVEVTVNGVNDAPTGTDNTITINEDTPHTFAASDFGFGDVDTGDTLQSVRIDTLSLDADATLELNDVAVTQGQEIAVGDLGNLIFTPGADENGADYSSFTFSVGDGTDFDAAPNTLTFDVTPVNDAPLAPPIDGPTTNEDAETYSLDLLQNASDPDGPTDLDVAGVVVSSSNEAREVLFSVNEETGLFELDPDQFGDLESGENETITIDYNVVDGEGGVTPTSASFIMQGLADNVTLFDENGVKLATYVTIQEAIDAAADGYSVDVKAGSYNENIVLDKALTISGEVGSAGEPLVTIGTGSGNAVTISAVAAGETATLQNFKTDGGSNGVDVLSAAMLAMLVIDNADIANAAQSGFDANDTDGVEAIEILNSAFTKNGLGGSNGAGDIVIFEYTGDVMLKDIAIQGADAGTTPRADNAIQISGFELSDYDVQGPIGTVIMDGVSVVGDYDEPHLAVKGYTDLSGLSVVNSSLEGSAGWGYLVFIDPVASTSPDAAGDVAGRPGNFPGGAETSALDLSDLTVVNNSPNNPGFDVFVRGTDADDMQTGTEANDALGAPAEGDQDLGGEETLFGLGGNDILFGGVEDDTLDGGDGNDLIEGLRGSDTINGGDGNDIINAGGQADFVDGGDGNDHINAGGGRDTVYFSAGLDYANGGGGYDTLVLYGTPADYAITILGQNHFQITRASDGASTEAESFENLTFVSADPLDAVDDTFTVSAGGIVELDVLDNDSGVGVTILAANVISGEGSAAPNVAGDKVLFDLTTGFQSLNAGESGEAELLYLAYDGSTSDLASIMVSVEGVADPIGPVSDNDAAANEISEGLGADETVGITALAIDPDQGSSTSYRLTDDADGAFQIDETTGVVTTTRELDREGEDGAIRSITVEATSSDLSVSSQSFDITILDVADEPVAPVTDADEAANAVDEGAETDTLIGLTASSEDPDLADSVTYSLDDDADGAFQIDELTGVVSVLDGMQIDRERDDFLSVMVRATSTDGTFEISEFFIDVNDVSEFSATAPADEIGEPGGSVSENAAEGTGVGIDVDSTDDDATNNVITYSLFDDDGGRFAIDEDTGEVLTGSVAIDREEGAERTITVRATSSDGSFADSDFTIAVTDVDEFDVTIPVDANGADNVVAANPIAGDLTGLVAFASDDDATNNAITYSLVVGDDDFDIDAVSGEVTVDAGFDPAGPTVRQVTVQASSSDGSTAQANFSISIGQPLNVIIGTPAADDLTGTENADAISGLAANDDLFGLAGNDVLTGGSGRDLLDGGEGDDEMYGGEDNDTYIVDSLADSVIEDPSGGTRDTVITSVTLPNLAANVEDLRLAGSDDLDGTGNELANRIFGNDGANSLFGLNGRDKLYGEAGADILVGGLDNDILDGGSGNDILFGGAGRNVLIGGRESDQFVFDVLPGTASEYDRIRDFTGSQGDGDKLIFDASVFTSLAGGITSDNIFIVGTGVQDADDYLIYDPSNDRLYYDADGSLSGEDQVEIARFDTPIVPVADDFGILVP